MFDDNGDGKRVLYVLFWLTVIALLIMAMVGCKTVEYVPVPETHTEYVYRDRVDSVRVHDSVYVKEIQKGDTVKVVEYRWRDRFQYISITDTLILRDTATVVVEKVVEKVDHSLMKWQKALIWWGVFCLLALIAYIIIRLRLRRP